MSNCCTLNGMGAQPPFERKEERPIHSLHLLACVRETSFANLVATDEANCKKKLEDFSIL
jgi:hypothetical protein